MAAITVAVAQGMGAWGGRAAQDWPRIRHYAHIAKARIFTEVALGVNERGGLAAARSWAANAENQGNGAKDQKRQ